jgi:ankyrin repeat protein
MDSTPRADLARPDREGFTPLATACLAQETDIEVVLMLLDAGCSVFAHIPGNRQCMFVAVERGLDAVVQKIIDLQPETLDLTCGSDIFIPLQVAIQFKQTSVLALLLRLGARTDSVAAETGDTLLVQCVLAKNKPALQLLLMHDADSLGVGLFDEVSLLVALCIESEEIDMLFMLYTLPGAKAVDLNRIIVQPENYTALHIACLKNSPFLVHFLLQQGADIGAVDQRGRDAVQLCREVAASKALRVLTEHMTATAATTVPSVIYSR